MPESIKHYELVKELINEARTEVPQGNWKMILTDSSESSNLPPKTSEGFRPDIYYNFDNLLVIGEAKTSNDIDRQHSRSQYESYLKECSRFNGVAIFILAVPILDGASANNILQKIRKKYPGDYRISIRRCLC